jgi:hypothetical protein
MISWWCTGHQSHKLLTKNTSYQGVTFYWVPLHKFSEVLQLCFKPLSHVHWKFTASCVHTVPTTNVQHKIIHKRSSKKQGKFLLIFAEIVDNQTLNFVKKIYCPNHWVTLTNTQYKVYFAFNRWNSGKLNLKLQNPVS